MTLGFDGQAGASFTATPLSAEGLSAQVGFGPGSVSEGVW
jgi:hypothetical protein